MTRASLVILLLATGFVSGAEEAAEVAAKPPAGKFSNLARLFARESGNSPIGLLLSAYVAEEEGRMVKAAATYQDLLDFLPSTSRWGRVACVRMARCLLSQQIPKVDEAQAALDRLSSATDTTLDNERQLWAMVIRFHRSAEQWINAKGGRFDEHLDARIAQWTPPADMRQRFALSLRMLCNRFTRVKKNWEGVQFLRGILLRLKNPQLQRVAMRELVVKQLAADEPADALLTARAYWLSSIDSPGAFPEAIAVVVRCMRALKATKEQVEAYRIGQTYGTDVSGRGKGGIAGSRLRDLVAKHASGRSIIPQKFIDGETSPAARARLCLLNGDLASAVPIALKMARSTDMAEKQRQRVLALIRMALALHDGHIHEIDRYEHYLYLRSEATGDGATSDGKIENPLEKLIGRPESHDSKANK